jgi:Toprim domain-containing protein
MLGIVRRSAIKLAAPRNGELVIAEGVETAMAAMQLRSDLPAWALGSAGAINFFPLVRGVRHLLLAQEADRASRLAIDACARRWQGARRRTSIFSSKVGSDLNDAIIHLARA